MQNIYVRFIANFADPVSRPYAHMQMLEQLEKESNNIIDPDKQMLLTKTLDFSTKYSKALPWKKRNIIISELKSML